MTMDRIYYAYMALVGAAAGAILVAVPQAQDFFIKPYFWILIAVGLFDAACYVRGGNAPGTMLTMPSRLIGFAVAIVLLMAIPMLAGAPVRYF